MVLIKFTFQKSNLSMKSRWIKINKKNIYTRQHKIILKISNTTKFLTLEKHLFLEFIYMYYFNFILYLVLKL